MQVMVAEAVRGVAWFDAGRMLKVGLATALLAMGMMLAVQAAEAKVGELDGKAGPSLPALATPGFGGAAPVEARWVVDWAYADKLVKDEDWQSALGVYQELRYRSDGADLVRALEGVARMQERLGHKEHAVKAYREVLTLLPTDSARRSETLARMVVLSDTPDQRLNQRMLARELVPTMVTGDRWAAWGLEQAVWAEARATLQVSETYGLASAEALQARLVQWQVDSTKRREMAARMAMVPGLGLFYLGDWRAGLGTFSVFMMVLVLVFGTSNRRQWGVAVWWWLVLGGIVLTAPGMAAERADVMAQKELDRILAR